MQSQPEQDSVSSPDSRAGREGSARKQGQRLWVLLMARKDQPLKSPEPFNLCSDSSFLIPTF